MNTRREDTRPKWWQFPWKEIGSFTLGASILLWETVGETQAQAILVGAGLALIGVTGVGAVQRAVKRKLEDVP